LLVGLVGAAFADPLSRWHYRSVVRERERAGYSVKDVEKAPSRRRVIRGGGVVVGAVGAICLVVAFFTA
jgi:hypothetical protein